MSHNRADIQHNSMTSNVIFHLYKSHLLVDSNKKQHIVICWIIDYCFQFHSWTGILLMLSKHKQWEYSLCPLVYIISYSCSWPTNLIHVVTCMFMFSFTVQPEIKSISVVNVIPQLDPTAMLYWFNPIQFY